MNDPVIKSYRDLHVWQEAMALAEACYRLTRSFPREELFGMSSQVRRSAVSIPANVAEGHGRENTQTFVQYLRIAQGSLKELETHLLLAERIGLAGNEPIEALMKQCASVGKMLRSLIRSLQQKIARR